MSNSDTVHSVADDSSHTCEYRDIVEAMRCGEVDVLYGDEPFVVKALKLEKENQRLLASLEKAKRDLEAKNRRLAELYETAHRFVDNVSHEFRTPLTVIQEYSSIVREGIVGEVNDEQCKCLDIVSDRVGDLAIMVNDMLDISKLEAGILGLRRKKCQVEEIIERVRLSLEQKAAIKNVSIEFSVPQDLPGVYCDAEKAGRVIINLAVNAIKFVPESGHIRVWARDDADNSQVLIGVSDNGPGISQENLSLIFQRFKQVGGNVKSSTKGFGLGLNIAKELVHLNLGEIQVESEVGRGSTFSFSVPIADPKLVIGRYLKRLERVQDDPSFVSLFAVTVDPTVQVEALDDLDEFLHSLLRRNDLLYRTDQHTWLLASDVQQHDQQLVINRFRDSWAEANRNRPGGALPEFNLDVKATYPNQSP